MASCITTKEIEEIDKPLFEGGRCTKCPERLRITVHAATRKRLDLNRTKPNALENVLDFLREYFALSQFDNDTKESRKV